MVLECCLQSSCADMGKNASFFGALLVIKDEVVDVTWENMTVA